MKFRSATVTAVSGSIGGLTGSHNKGGMYFRARSQPVNTNTSFQQVVRNFLSQVTAAWQQILTAAQRAAWETYAANVPLIDSLGESRNVSGIAMYVRSNVIRLQAGLARIDAGPTTFSLPTFTAPTVAVDATADEMDVAYTSTDAWAGEVGGAMIAFASRPQAASINYFRGPYRLAGIVAGAATPPTSPETLTLPFPVVVGHVVHSKIAVVRADGRLSSPFRLSSVAT